MRATEKNQIDLRTVLKFDTEDQFLIHTKKHISNVEKIAKNMLKEIGNSEEYMNHFDIPNKKALKNFERKFNQLIKIHDIGKTNDNPEFLKEHGLSEPIYKTLSKFAGVNLDKSDRNLIEKLNTVDEKETLKKSKELGMSEWEFNLYDFIEHSSDIVDRGCNPITAIEMNKNVFRASEFGSFRPQVEQNLIESSEKFYDNNLLTHQYEFAYLVLSPKEENIKQEQKIEQAQTRKVAYK